MIRCFSFHNFHFSYLTILKTTEEKKNHPKTKQIATQQDISWPISLKNEGYDFSYKPRDSLTPTLIFITLSARFCCCGSKSLPLWSVTLEVISSSFWDFEACCCLHSWFRGQWSLRRWTELFHNRPSVMSRWGGQYTQSTIIMGGWIGVMVNRDYTINFFFSPVW